MEVGDCPLTVYTQHSALLSNLLRNMIAHSFCPSLSSIGGDQNLDSVTTLPSKSRCGFPCELCTSSPVDGALGSRQTAGFYFSPPSEFLLFFVCTQTSSGSLILKSRECQWDKGATSPVSTWLCPELKLSESKWFILHIFCVFPALKCCSHLQIFILNTEKSRIRSGL